MKTSRKTLLKILKEEFDKVDQFKGREKTSSDDDLDVTNTKNVLEDLDESEGLEESKIIKISQRDFYRLVIESIVEQAQLDAPEPEDTAVGKRYAKMEAESEEESQAVNFIQTNVDHVTSQKLVNLYKKFLRKFSNNWKLFEHALTTYIEMSGAYEDDYDPDYR